MIVVVTGGRDYPNTPRLFSVLDEIHVDTPISLIRNGGMTGADALSSRWAYSRKVDTECFGALWGQFGSGAGPERNVRMLRALPVAGLVVAFFDRPEVESRGTAHCCRAAEQHGIPVRRVLP